MNITCIIQARLGSKRFPGKVLKTVLNKSIIELVVDRVRLSKKINQIVVAIPNTKVDDKLFYYLKKRNIKIFRGSEKNVLKRFYEAAKIYNSKIIVRITSDCPLVDPKIIDSMIKLLIDKKKDYVSNASPPSFPDGLDVEVFNFKSLRKAYFSTKDKYDLEHVTPFFRKSGKFNTYNYASEQDYSNFRVTLDEKKDLDLIRNIYSFYKPNKNFGWDKLKKLIIKKPKKFDKNKSIMRNSKIKNKGQELWNKAKKIIPNGNMLLSKRPELFYLTDGQLTIQRQKVV